MTGTSSVKPPCTSPLGSMTIVYGLPAERPPVGLRAQVLSSWPYSSCFAIDPDRDRRRGDRECDRDRDQQGDAHAEAHGSSRSA